MPKRLLLPVLFGLLASAPAPAAAQSYAVQVWDQLQNHWKTISKNDTNWYLGNYVMGRVATGGTDSWTFYFDERRSYVITGACDNDCRNVDLVVKDEAGAVVDKDQEPDGTPVVTLKPARSGRYSIEVTIVECKEEPCYFGIGIYLK